MVYLERISKSNCQTLFEELNKINQDINDVKESLKSEILNSDLDLAYDGNYNYDNLQVKNLTFLQIKNLIEYMKNHVDYQQYLKLDEIKDLIANWFYNKLLEDCFFSKEPKSYGVVTKLDSLLFDITSLDKDYFQVDARMLGVFSIEKLNELEVIILRDLYEIKKKLNLFKEKENSSLRADSDYVKRNKK